MVRGEVDADISAQLQSVMSPSPSVFWRRADEVGALYDLFLRRLLKMEELVWSRKWLAAYLLMRDLDTFLDACDIFNEDAGRGDDATLMASLRDMYYRLLHNRLLIQLYLAMTYWAQVDMRPFVRKLLNDAIMQSRDTLPLCIPTIELVCATCHFMLEEYDLCWERVDKVHEANKAGLWKAICTPLRELESSLPRGYRQASWRPNRRNGQAVLDCFTKLMRPIQMDDFPLV